jgi:hypothetical protein
MKNREDLKKLFVNGAKPNQKDFEDLIDSCFNKLDEPRQEVEVVSNAGWYHHRFLPHAIGDSVNFSFGDRSGEDVAFFQNNPPGLVFSVIGGMNIIKPKGLRKIEKIRVAGDLVHLVGDPLKIVLDIFNSLDKRAVISYPFTFPPSRSEDSDINETVTIDKNIDPDEGSLFIRITVSLDTSRILTVLPNTTRITIRRIGIKLLED